MSFRIYAVDESVRVGLARDERRTSRAACGATVQVQGSQSNAFGFCSDLSLGGMLFVGTALPVSQKVAVRLQLPDSGLILIIGEVTGHRNHEGSPASIIRFPRLNARNLRLISRFLATHLTAKPSFTPASA